MIHNTENIESTRERITLEKERLLKVLRNSKNSNLSKSVHTIIDAFCYYRYTCLGSIVRAAYSSFQENLSKVDNDISEYLTMLSSNTMIKKYITYTVPWEEYEPQDIDVIEAFEDGTLRPDCVNYFLEYLNRRTDKGFNYVVDFVDSGNYNKYSAIVSHFNVFKPYNSMSPLNEWNTPNIHSRPLILNDVFKRNSKVLIPNNSTYKNVIENIIDSQMSSIDSYLKIYDKGVQEKYMFDSISVSKLELTFVKCLVETNIETYSCGWSSELDRYNEELYEERECYCDDEEDECECDPTSCVYVDMFLPSKCMHRINF